MTKILGYVDTGQAIIKHVDHGDRRVKPLKTTGNGRRLIFLNESGFYSLLLSSKLELANKEYQHKVTK